MYVYKHILYVYTQGGREREMLLHIIMYYMPVQTLVMIHNSKNLLYIKSASHIFLFVNIFPFNVLAKINILIL